MALTLQFYLHKLFPSGCFLQASISSGGVVKCFGIMYVAFMEEFNSKAGAAAWIIGLCIALQHFAGK